MGALSNSSLIGSSYLMPGWIRLKMKMNQSEMKKMMNQSETLYFDLDLVSTTFPLSFEQVQVIL